MEITEREKLMILAVRETGLDASNVLTCVYNIFFKDNKDRQWSGLLEIIDNHLQLLDADSE